MNELKQARITMGIHVPASIGVGYISSFLDGWLAGLTGIIVLLGCGFLSEKLTRKKGIKFWLANGIFIYLMFWLISWTVFINL